MKDNRLSRPHCRRSSARPDIFLMWVRVWVWVWVWLARLHATACAACSFPNKKTQKFELTVVNVSFSTYIFSRACYRKIMHTSPANQNQVFTRAMVYNITRYIIIYHFIFYTSGESRLTTSTCNRLCIFIVVLAP